MSAAIAASVAAVAFHLAAEPRVTLQRFSLEAYPEAVCNDGSPAMYYFREGAPGAPWVVHLEGGGWCWDRDSCRQRAANSPRLTSSKDTPASMGLGGLYAARSGPFRNAHIVFLSYCSSDAHMGNRGASAETFGLHFRGQRIVEAMLRELVGLGLGAAAEDQLLFGGCSAGGRGAMATLDFVPEMLADAGAPSVQVRGLLDAILWIDDEPLDSSVVSLMDRTRSLFELANATARAPAECQQAHADEPWRCIFAEYRLPFLKLPHVLSFVQYDYFQIELNLGRSLPSWNEAEWSEKQRVYVKGFRARVLDFLQRSPVPPGSLYFGSACVGHCTAPWLGSLEQNQAPRDDGRVTLLDAVGTWWRFLDARAAAGDGLGSQARLVDACDGVACGCGSGAWSFFPKAIRSESASIGGANEGAFLGGPETP